KISFAGHVLCHRIEVGPADETTAGAAGAADLASPLASPFLSCAAANIGNAAIAAPVVAAAFVRNLRRDVRSPSCVVASFFSSFLSIFSSGRVVGWRARRRS